MIKHKKDSNTDSLYLDGKVSVRVKGLFKEESMGFNFVSHIENVKQNVEFCQKRQ